MSWMIVFIVIVAIFLAIKFSVLQPLVDKTVFFPRREDSPEAVKFEGISGIWIQERREHNILYFHGNAGLASEARNDSNLMKYAKTHGMGIFAVDPSGYGVSDGVPSLGNIKADAVKAADFLGDKVTVWGMSMGGAYALHAAEYLGSRCNLLILQSTFGELFDCVSANMRSLLALIVTGYSNLGAIKGSRFPIRIYHSRDDEIIPFLCTLKRPTLFTHDDGFFHSDFAHARYCLVWLDVKDIEAAPYVRRFLKHPRFHTQAKRMGVVARVHPGGIHFWQRNHVALQRVSWAGSR